MFIVLLEFPAGCPSRSRSCFLKISRGFFSLLSCPACWAEPVKGKKLWLRTPWYRFILKITFTHLFLPSLDWTFWYCQLRDTESEERKTKFLVDLVHDVHDKDAACADLKKTKVTERKNQNGQSTEVFSWARDASQQALISIRPTRRSSSWTVCKSR